MEQCLQKGMPITTTKCYDFCAQAEAQQKGAGRIECTRWLMEHFLFPRALNAVVKAGPFHICTSLCMRLLSVCKKEIK